MSSGYCCFLCVAKYFFKGAYIDSYMGDLYQSFLLPLYLMIHAVWIDSWYSESYHIWIVSHILESYHFFLLDLIFEALNRFTNLWIVSIFIWRSLNRFKPVLIRIKLHTSRLSNSTCLNRFRHLCWNKGCFAKSPLEFWW